MAFVQIKRAFPIDTPIVVFMVVHIEAADGAAGDEGKKMQTGMNIGTVVDAASLNPMTDAIIRILETNADQETKRHALDALSRMAKIENVTIQHCVVNGDRTIKIDMEDGTVETDQ